MAKESTRDGAVIAACMLAAAAASWARYVVDGDLATRGVAWQLWPGAIVGVAGAIAMRAQRRAAAGPPAWRAILRAAIAIHVVAAIALPLTSNDAWSNIAYGRLAAAGHSPFLVGPDALDAADPVRALVDPYWASVPMVYGPLAAAVARAAAITGTVLGDLFAFKLVMLAAALAAIALAVAACRGRFGDAEARARIVWFAWCPLLAWEVSAQAHNDGLVVAALVGFAWAATRRREAIAIACLAIGTAVKFVAAPVAVLYVAYVARTRPLRALALAAVFVAIFAAALAPWWRGADTFGALAHHAAPTLPHTSRSFADLFYWLAYPLGAAAQHVAYVAVAVAGMAACAAIGVVGIARARSPSHVIHYALVLFLAADLVGFAWFQPWYVLWALPLALVHPDRTWLVLTATYAALSLVAYVAPFDPVTNVAVDVYIGWLCVAHARRGAKHRV